MSWRDILKNDREKRINNAMKRVPAKKKDKYVPIDSRPKDWRDEPEFEKAHCASEKLDDKDPFEKKLVGNQKKIDANKDGKITGEDFKLLNKENPEKMILREIEKEGGALGMKNLKGIPNLKETLDRMVKEGKIFIHKDGDIYTHKPSRGRGFTR